MHLIADRLTVLGLRMNGLKNANIADERSVKEILTNISGDAKVIVITHSLAGCVKREIARLRKAGKIVVEIPDRSGAGEYVIGKLIRDVVGFELKK